MRYNYEKEKYKLFNTILDFMFLFLKGLYFIS